VNPTPVGINDNTAGHGSAATTGSTLGPGQRWVSLSRQSADLLGLDRAQECRKEQGTRVDLIGD
jgi:hypothetical protein